MTWQNLGERERWPDNNNGKRGSFHFCALTWFKQPNLFALLPWALIMKYAYYFLCVHASPLRSRVTSLNSQMPQCAQHTAFWQWGKMGFKTMFGSTHQHEVDLKHTIQLNPILDKIGQFGKFHAIQLLLMVAALYLGISPAFYSYAYTGYLPKYRCLVPQVCWNSRILYCPSVSLVH